MYRWFLDDTAYSEDRNFTEVDNRSEGIDTVGAEIADGESSAADVFKLELAGACFFSQHLGFGTDLGERLAVGIADYRDNQALVQRHRHPDVDLVEQCDSRIGKASIQPRMAL